MFFKKSGVHSPANLSLEIQNPYMNYIYRDNSTVEWLLKNDIVGVENSTISFHAQKKEIEHNCLQAIE